MMKKWMAVLLAALMLTGVAALAAADSDVEITATGHAQVTAVPDMVSVTANATVTAETVAKAQEQLSAIIDQATQSLKALGVSEDQITTTNYSFYPSYDYSDYSGGAAKITGYQANHTLHITCGDTALLDGVITAITDAGMNEIYSVEFDTSARKELYLKALELAVADAQEKAARMAAAGGVTITGVEQLIENEVYSYDAALYAARDESAKGVETGIRSGTVTVSASVTAVYDTDRR